MESPEQAIPAGSRMPSLHLSPSASGMRWFNTPEEYLSDWKPRIEWRTQLSENTNKKCPNCGNSNPHKIYYRRVKKNLDLTTWQCKRWYCHYIWPVKLTLVFLEMTPEEWVFARIKQRFDNNPANIQRLIHARMGIPLGVTLGSVEAMSNNNQAHRDGAVIAAMSAYQRYQQQQQQQQQLDYHDRLWAAEAQKAWAMAEQYFGVAERAAQAARNERYAEMQEMARLMAKEMFSEAARTRYSASSSTGNGSAHYS